MEIDNFSLITGTAFFVIIFGTFGLLIWLGKRRSGNITRLLRDLAKFHRLQLNAEEAWNDKALGLDKVTKKVIFIDNHKNRKDVAIMPLVGCTLVHYAAKEKEYVQLMLEFKNRREVLTLFDNHQDDPVEFGFHVKIAEKWTALIKEALPSRRKRPAKAA